MISVWVIALHGVQTGVAVTPSDHIELALEDGDSGCAAWRRHVGDVGPLLGGGVVSVREGVSELMGEGVSE